MIGTPLRDIVGENVRTMGSRGAAYSNGVLRACGMDVNEMSPEAGASPSNGLSDLVLTGAKPQNPTFG